MREILLDEFADHVGERFDLLAGERRLPFTLESAHELPRSLRESGSFRLGWRGPHEPLLPQAIYRFERDGESWDMFIVPIAQDDRATDYEAIFN